MIIYSDAKLITSSLPHTEKSLWQFSTQNLRTQAQIPLKFQMKLSIASRKTEVTQISNYGVSGDSSHGASTYYLLGYVSRFLKRHKLIIFEDASFKLGHKHQGTTSGLWDPNPSWYSKPARAKITRITFLILTDI